MKNTAARVGKKRKTLRGRGVSGKKKINTIT